MRLRSARRLLAIVAVAGGIGAGLFFGCGPGALDDLTRGDEPTRGDEVLPQQETGAEAGPACLATVQPRPEVDDPPQRLAPMVFAVHSLRLDTTLDAGTGLDAADGLDLDGKCTCCACADAARPSVEHQYAEPRSCRRLAEPEPKKECDGPQGVDNTAGMLANDIGTSQLVNLSFGAFRHGDTSVLLGIEEWSGDDDDPYVTVSLWVSTGLARSAPDAGPRWNGDDAWNIDPSSLLLPPDDGDGGDGGDAACPDIGGLCRARVRVTNAYVVKGTLVAKLSDLSIPLGGGSYQIGFGFQDVTLTAQIDRTKSPPIMRGQMAGRVPLDLFFSRLAYARDTTTVGSPSMCKSPKYPFIKDLACGYADLAADQSQDNTDASCGAMSGAFSFIAYSAHLGAVVGGVDGGTDCPGWTDSCDGGSD